MSGSEVGPMDDGSTGGGPGEPGGSGGPTGSGAAALGTIAGQRPFDRTMPPVIALGMIALSLAVVGGVLIASQIGTEPSLLIPRVFVVIALVLEAVAVVMMLRIRPFAWALFRKVFGVALCAYIVQSGIIGWTFIKNDVPTGPFVVLTGGLVVFATIVPLMIAFTVARYQAVD